MHAATLLLSLVIGQDFSTEVRPILATRCFTCHGPDAGQREAELRLDRVESATATLPSGRAAIVPFEVKESELVRRIFATDAEIRMPPADSGEVLSNAEKNTLRAWIKSGALYQDHWAFRPPSRADVPEPKIAGWAQNEVDRFVLARLRQQGMRPSAEANRVTLARRASLDLRGLPPSYEEVQSLVKDRSPLAWERYIDRMLASSRYGERMAEDWLDLARYGDTNGYHADSDRTMWLYRDYVIDSFNANKPFDEFIVENLAGDLLPNRTITTQIASGFNRCNTFNEEGGADPDEFRVAYAVDRTNTMGQVFLGLTVGCAQCHDHKYDPITQKDYYQLYAFFNNVAGEVGAGGPGGYHNKELPPLLSVPSAAQQNVLDALPEQRQGVQDRIASTLARYDAPHQEFDLRLTEWIEELRSQRVAPRPAFDTVSLWLDAGDLNGNGVTDGDEKYQPGAEVKVWKDRSENKYDAQALAAPAYLEEAIGGLPAVRFDGVGHHLRTAKGGGELRGDFTLVAVFRSILETNHQMLVMWGEESTGKRRSLWRHADGRFSFNGHARDVVGNLPLGKEPHIGVITYNSDSGLVRLFLDGKEAGQGSPALNDFANERITIGCNNNNGEFAGAELSEVMILKSVIGESDHQRLGQFLSTKYGIQSEYGGAPKEILDLVALATDERTVEQQTELRRYFAEHVYEESKQTFEGLKKELASLDRLEKSTRDAIPTTLVMVEQEERTPAYVLIRGDFQQRGEEVQPDVPGLFDGLAEGETRDRLGLARWLTSSRNPLTARVTVNRIWQQLFGMGLVKTQGDFGTQGDLPSHPALLDWLSVRFVNSGWDIKELQKLILMSATYRQSSFNPHQYDEIDPENRLLSRAPRFRLSAEQVRDVALSISGLLENRVGGPSVKPYQPMGYYRDKIGRDWSQAKGADLYRRSVYTYWRRTTLYPAFQIFDAPSREFCSGRRPRTNTPLQALVLLNDTGFVEAARVFAQRILAQGGETTADRLRYACQTALSREPTSEEESLLAQIVAEQQAHYSADSKRAEQLVGNGDAPVVGSIPDVAAWTAVASILLNLDETITRE